MTPWTGFDPELTPRVIALEIQQRLNDEHDIESELMMADREDGSQFVTLSLSYNQESYRLTLSEYRVKDKVRVGQVVIKRGVTWMPAFCCTIEDVLHSIVKVRVRQPTPTVK